MNPFPIVYAFRPRLRGRLTLGRRPLPRNPSVFGEGESHPLIRYSCLHSRFRSLQRRSRGAFIGIRNVRLPTFDTKCRICRGFGTRRSPVTLSVHDDSTSELLRTRSRGGCF